MQKSVKRNITNLSNCYGCGVCSVVCPVKIISLEENSDGFYQPIIKEQNKCIDCGLCLKICGFNNVLAQEYSSEFYIGWTKDDNARHNCTSGGIAYEIIKYGVTHNFYVTSAIYDAFRLRAAFKTSHRIDEILTYVGSKYIPSSTNEALIRLNYKDKNIVVGLPCQMHSLRMMLRHYRCEENFVLVDFFCHGVPSLKLWDKYLDYIRRLIGQISAITWRNKDRGWKKSYCIKANGEYGEYYSRASDGDLFYKFFLGNYCLNHCCYDSCQYKQTNSAADIRLGDCWGTRVLNQDEGVSSILIFSDKGKKIINALKESCEITQVPRFEVLNGQMKKSASRPFIQPLITKALLSNKSIRIIYTLYVRPYEILWIFPQRIYRKILRIVHRK